jgi:hypothetical protein
LATKITNPNSNTEARFSKTQEPFRLCATDGKQAVDYWVMDVDSFGAECVQNNVMAGSSDLKREPDVLNGDKLQNEFFTAIVDSKTGGLRSIQFHGKRGNRGGQRIVFHDEARPNTPSQMICRSLKSTALSKIGGQIETEGAILIDQVEVAEFRQTFRLFRGQRHLEIEIQLTPKVTLPPSANTWFASQLAWQDEACKLYGACQLAKFEAVDPLILSPNFVEMSMSDYSLTLLAGGLPAHRRTARCRLDTMLVVGNEQQRNFRLALGINISHAARAAINFGSPIYSLDQLPSDKAETNSLARCLLHLDCKNIISTFCEPVFADGKLVAVRLRLQETEGRAGRLQISTPLRLTKVERQDVRGNANLVLEIDADMHRVGLEFSQHDFFQVELLF